MQKRPKDTREEVSRGRTSKQGNGMWAPSSSEEDEGDSEDSMSDLYPSQSPLRPSQVVYQFNACSSSFLECCAPTAHLFTLKNPTEEPTGGDGNKEEDDFQTDGDEDMEAEAEAEALHKRKKVSARSINLDWDGGRIRWTP